MFQKMIIVCNNAPRIPVVTVVSESDCEPFVGLAATQSWVAPVDHLCYSL